MHQWTQEQLFAIQARNNQLLVSAAAGSGKTAVLVERIVDLIRRDGLSIDRMLIVTFTRAAAAEMRERIQLRLSKEAQDDPRMEEQLDRLELSQIGTLHGFCQQVLRQHFQAVGLDPQARLCDPAEGSALFRQALEDALTECYQEASPDFLFLQDCFEQEEITRMAEELYPFLMSLPDPFQWLRRWTEKPPDQAELEGAHPWTRHVMGEAEILLEGAGDIFKDMEKLFALPEAVPELAPLMESDRRLMDQMHQAWEAGPAALRRAAAGAAFQRAPALRGLSPESAAWRDRYKSLRDGLKELAEAIRELLPDAYAAQRELEAMAPAMRGLRRVMETLHRLFSGEKRERGLIDFSDLEHLTLEVLSHPELKETVAGGYDEIFVDEYQDVSGIQHAIIQAVHNEKNRLFMVGDVKQSIYRFRLADPTLFLNQLAEFSPKVNAPKRKIALQKNFRSLPPVLSCVNQVFFKAMNSRVTEIDYDEAAKLVPGRAFQEEAWRENAAFPELHLVKAPAESEEKPVSKYGQEGRLAAALIQRQLLIPITDGKTGEKRLPSYRDIAILLPKMKGAGAEVCAALKEEGIPYFADGDEDYFSLPEIDGMMKLLAALDNPFQDIPLLSALRLPALDFTEEELGRVRLCRGGKGVPFSQAFEACRQTEGYLGEKCRAAAKMLSEWRFLVGQLPLSQVIWRLLAETGLYRRAGALPGGQARQANLRLLCQRAKEYQEGSGGDLSGFLKLNDALRAAQDKRSAKLLGEGENLVRVMTIHKSKGLEFPVVILLGLSERTAKPARGKLLFHCRLGLALPYVNPELRITRPAFSGKAIQSLKKKEERAERLRLLYVAMTRAREKLYLAGTVKEWPQESWLLPPGPYRVMKAASMLDWVCQALWDAPGFQLPREKTGEFSTGEMANTAFYKNLCTQSTGFPQSETPWKIKGWSLDVHSAVEKEQNFHTLLAALKNVGNEPVDPLIQELMESAVEKREAPLPLKTSVTALLKSRLFAFPAAAFDQEEEDRQAKAREEELISPLTMSPLPARPAFLEEKEVSRLKGAERGTAVHGALSALPFAPLQGLKGAALKSAVREQLDKLREQGVLTKAQREAIPLNWITGFLESEIGQRTLAAKAAQREWAFNLRLSPSAPTLVQGVVDLAFWEDGGWVLVDYKTDLIQEEEAFAARYGPQIALYRRAVAEILAQPVKEAWLFALREGKAYLQPADQKEKDERI